MLLILPAHSRDMTLVAVNPVLSVLSDVEKCSGSCAERMLMEQVVWSRQSTEQNRGLWPVKIQLDCNIK